MENIIYLSKALVTSFKPHLGNVSLVCVESRYPALARFAIDRCLMQATFKECLLLTPLIHELPDYIRQVVIPPIGSIEAYSDFMVRGLGDYFSGSHVLVIQWDSFIVRGDLWDPRFLDYDYIGAPWPHRPVGVGNGGFSLRSRKLVDALRHIAMPATHPEDYVICEAHGEELSSRYGIRFAPLEVARQFAYEGIVPAAPTFGFHGIFNFHRVLDEATVSAHIIQCDNSILHGHAARRFAKQLYLSGYYRLFRQVLKRRLSGGVAMVMDVISLGARGTLHAWRNRHQPAKPIAHQQTQSQDSRRLSNQ
jgi:hypothetical protein